MGPIVITPQSIELLTDATNSRRTVIYRTIVYINSLMTEKFVVLRYSSYVAEMLEEDCTVHHSPWSGDGGALDTNHVLKCLPLLLSSSVYEPVQYDAIIFNSGLHDVNCCNFPREVKGHSNVRYKYMKEAMDLNACVNDAMLIQISLPTSSYTFRIRLLPGTLKIFSYLIIT